MKLAVDSGLYVSVDTNKPKVAEEALTHGAGMINDITGLRSDAMRRICAEHECSVCIMHMMGEPKNMQANPVYLDVVEEVKRYLFEAARAMHKRRHKRRALYCLDPGFGFGKSLEDNYKMLSRLNEFKESGMPVLAGVSRKSMIGAVTGKSPVELPLAW